MLNPAYLVKSRNGIFYLRWPIPTQLHPQNKQSTLKLSLRTRDPRKALRLSRSLSHVGDQLNDHGIVHGMRYSEIRTLLTDHFRELLEQSQNEIDAKGRLTEEDRQVLKSSIMVAKQAAKTDTPLSLVKPDDDLLDRFIEKYRLPIQTGSDEYGWLEQEIKPSYRDYLKAVLAYDKSLQSYSFESRAAPSAGEPVKTATPAGMTITEIADAYTKERLVGKAWAAKTTIEKADHIRLLKEILGSETDVRTLTALHVKRVKETLLAYPRNRNKNPLTRDRQLEEVLSLPNIETIRVPTINKYLQTYSDLFEWAKQNNHTDANLFSGLTVRQGKKDRDGARDPYTDEQIRLILTTILHNERGLVTKDYQKWASLIGIYTGARLGEISQLHLKDIRQQDGIWCFDMNEQGDRKSLKSSAARRLVPIHSQLIQAGLLDHVNNMRDRGALKLFPDFNYDPKNGWGRHQSRWFNNTLLVKLGLKSKTRVFHSLRHTVNTRLLQAGVPDPIVKAIIGHEQQGMTQQQYFKEGYKLQQLNAALQLLNFNPELVAAAQ